MKEECKATFLCPVSMEATVYCGRCDFDPHAHICAWIKSSWNVIDKKKNDGICPTVEEKVYTGGPTQYSFTGKRI